MPSSPKIEDPHAPGEVRQFYVLLTGIVRPFSVTLADPEPILVHCGMAVTARSLGEAVVLCREKAELGRFRMSHVTTARLYRPGDRLGEFSGVVPPEETPNAIRHRVADRAKRKDEKEQALKGRDQRFLRSLDFDDE